MAGQKLKYEHDAPGDCPNGLADSQKYDNQSIISLNNYCLI